MSTYTDLTKLENSRHCLRRIARHDEPQFSKDSIVNVMEKFVKTVNCMGETILVPSRLMDRQVGDSNDIIPAPGKDSTSNQHTMHAHGGHGKRAATQSKNVHEFLNSSELFNLYNMLHALKNELLWTGKDAAVEEEEYTIFMEQNKIYGELETPNTVQLMRSESEVKTENANTTEAAAPETTENVSNGNTMSNSSSSGTIKGHNRRPSTASVASTVSVVSVSNLSDSESEISNENDSGVEFEANKSDNPQSSSAGSTSSSENLRAQKMANVDKATELAMRCKRHLNGLYHCLEQMTEAANYLTARYQSDIGPV